MPEINRKIKRDQILNKLIKSAKQCQEQFGGRKELATEKDDVTARLLNSLEDAFFFGLKSQPTSLPIAIFQNVHEIVSGNTTTTNDFLFWDFCQKHLTNHEQQRFDGLKNVTTKCGKAKAFIRASLNENSLGRYILTWLYDPSLGDIYESWAFMVDPEAANLLPSIADGLNTILFALAVDTQEVDLQVGYGLARKPEPIIYAPSPIGSLKKTTAIERPIAGVEAAEDVVSEVLPNRVRKESCRGSEELVTQVTESTPSQETVDYEPECLTEILHEMLTKKFDHEIIPHEPEILLEAEADTKSETSSQCSKSSSAVSNPNVFRQQSTTELEQKLRDMTERCTLLETRVAQLSLENRQLRRLTHNAVTETTANFLITIPQAKLITTRSRNYYSYEVHITMRDRLEHWLVMRRYREFHKLHKQLKKIHPGISTIEFPPKKHFGNMNRIFVEERRQQLQIYLISVMEFLPQVEACRNKEELQRIFPFFQDR
ncbi:sorting nexin-29 [Episyrphus balteatus]|uniref:sorting nexin-29 n=1 Tax=Episyrphus balteatus TaxID=286459 RepID=UPI002484E929|nr:sorting nexin-29 [Episyrphus balteatus]